MTLSVSRRFSSSASRWLILAGFALAGMAWTICLGVPADVMAKGRTIMFATGLVAISLAFGRFGYDIIADVFDTGAQVLFLVALGNWLSCLTITTFGGFPLRDMLFSNIDEKMGLDWIAWWNLLQRYPHFHYMIGWIYTQESTEYAIILLYLCVIQKTRERDRLMFATFFSSFIVLLFSAPLPAIGASLHYGVYTPNWTESIYALRARTGDVLLSFGSISFPSFHTVVALLLIDASRHNRWLFCASLAFNGLMLLAIPTIGSHYFVDMLGGAAVTGLALWIVHRLDRVGTGFHEIAPFSLEHQP